MTWTPRSLIAFAVGLFATTVFAEGLYHLIGTPGCQSTVTTPVRCSQESGWWALVLGGGLVVALTSMRAARGSVARMLLGALLLGGGLAPLWAVLDERTDAGGWIVGGAVAVLLGVAVLAGLAAAALGSARQPAPLARTPEPLGKTEAATPVAPAADAPAVRLGSAEDPFGREAGESTDPFGGER